MDFNALHILFFRVSDKRRNIAAQKAEAQRRLFRTSRKPDTQDVTTLDKKKASMDKRKEELVRFFETFLHMCLPSSFINYTSFYALT